MIVRGIEEQVARSQAVALGCEPMNAMSDFHLPFDVACLAAFVDQQTDHGGAVLDGEPKHLVEA